MLIKLLLCLNLFPSSVNPLGHTALTIYYITFGFICVKFQFQRYRVDRNAESIALRKKDIRHTIKTKHLAYKSVVLRLFTTLNEE